MALGGSMELAGLQGTALACGKRNINERQYLEQYWNMKAFEFRRELYCLP